MEANRNNPLPRAWEFRAKEIGKIRHPAHLARLMETEENHLSLLAAKPRYKTYEIPKKDGSWRLIEDPEDNLKEALRTLNEYLQPLYLKQRPDAVHGFVISTFDEEQRGILTNAKAHLSSDYILNMDLEDFFHNIRKPRVTEVFTTHLPNLNPESLRLLSCLTTHKGRLPMGSPTSPVLSNFASLELDWELENICAGEGIKYTRYADDLTFSGHRPIPANTVNLIRSVIRHRGFLINEDKVRPAGPGDEKIVTGIRVSGEEISLPEGYIRMLHTEIYRLESVMAVEARYRTGMSGRKLNRFIMEVNGKISFAKRVLGSDHPEIMQMENLLQKAINPDSAFLSADWLDIPYDFF